MYVDVSASVAHFSTQVSKSMLWTQYTCPKAMHGSILYPCSVQPVFQHQLVCGAHHFPTLTQSKRVQHNIYVFTIACMYALSARSKCWSCVSYVVFACFVTSCAKSDESFGVMFKLSICACVCMCLWHTKAFHVVLQVLQPQHSCRRLFQILWEQHSFICCARVEPTHACT
jgi:hypothetical protein